MKYEDFLKQTIYSEEFNKTAKMEEIDGKVYIIYDDKKILFKMLYEERLYDYLLIAAKHLFEASLKGII